VTWLFYFSFLHSSIHYQPPSKKKFDFADLEKDEDKANGNILLFWN